jgi:hypothetical protein
LELGFRSARAIGLYPLEFSDFLPSIKQYPRGIQILNGRRLCLVPLIGSRQFEKDSFFFLASFLAAFVAVAVSPAASPGVTAASSAVH